MKKGLVGLLCTIMVFSLLGCGGTVENKTEAGNDETESVDDDYAQTDGNLGDYYFSIEDCAYAVDDEGRNVIIIDIQYTNNGDVGEAFVEAAIYVAYQDGIEIESTFDISDKSIYNYDNAWTNIKDGATITAQVAYVLSGDSDVNFELKEYNSFTDGTVLKKTFKAQ